MSVGPSRLPSLLRCGRCYANTQFTAQQHTNAIKPDLTQYSDRAIQSHITLTAYNINMLPFTDKAERRRRQDRARAGSEVRLRFKQNIRRRQRPDVGADEQAPQRYQPRTPTALLFPHAVPRDDTPPSPKVPRLSKSAPSTQQSKDACKQDLRNCAFFAELDATTASSSQSQWDSPSRSIATSQNQSTQATTPPDSSLAPKDDSIDDSVWNDCKERIPSLETTIDSTFQPPSTDSPTFIFGDEHRKAEATFDEAKATIHLASTRLSQHYWEHELPADKRAAMLQTQISFGQRIRRAWGEAMERREAWLDRLMEQQVELGSEEMEELLNGLDERWSDEDWGDREDDELV